MSVIDWLFNTREGVFALLGGGVVLFLIISAVLERQTRRRFKNHAKGEGDWDLFGSDEDSESGWSTFEDDNH